MNTCDVENLEKAALVKYEDLLDTILVVEAVKQQKNKKGTSWKNLKNKLKSNVWAGYQ